MLRDKWLTSKKPTANFFATDRNVRLLLHDGQTQSLFLFDVGSGEAQGRIAVNGRQSAAAADNVILVVFIAAVVFHLDAVVVEQGAQLVALVAVGAVERNVAVTFEVSRVCSHY